jgi:hypothetical protein
MDKNYYRLNYEISPWLPKGSIWYRDEDGHWEREDGSHSVGGDAGDGKVYWFALLLEQESTRPSGTSFTDRILTKVQRSEAWVEADES